MESLHLLLSPSTPNNNNNNNEMSPLISFKVCLGRGQALWLQGGFKAGAIDCADRSTTSNVTRERMKERYHQETHGRVTGVLRECDGKK